MERPQYLILGKNPDSIVAALDRADDGRLFPLFFPRSGPSFFDLLTPTALAQLKREMKVADVSEIRERYRESAVSGDDLDDDDLDDDDSVTPRDLVVAAAIVNPHVFFSYDPRDGFQKQPTAKTRGYAVPCQMDPAGLDLSGVAVGTLQILFGADGAPAQQHRAPGRHGGATFLRRSGALRAVGRTVPPPRNARVHVFVVDQGMHPDYVNALGGPGAYGGTIWDTLPIPGASLFPLPELGELPIEHRHRYRSMPNWHAHMIVRNILSVAGGNHGLDPETERPIVFYDVPVIPNRVASVTGTAYQIWFQMWAILSKIIDLFDECDNDRFVIVNAWGVKNRLREEILGSVTDNLGHPLNGLIGSLAQRKGTAVVFAAGNAGSFTPDPETSPYDRGPGRSIWYPNALDNVINTGACDVNGHWIGSSSQGKPVLVPGDPHQPVFSAPSYFQEDLDAHIRNTGSSASCGLLAGLVAARWRRNPAPLDLNAAQSGARRHGHTGHSPHLGWGVIQDTTL